MGRRRQDEKKIPPGLPDKDAILRFIADNPGNVGKRELARAFSVKGENRPALKQLLAEMEEEGLLARKGKRLARRGDLPPVMVLDIVARDRDGGLLARPASWNEAEDGAAPTISIRQPKGRNSVIAGIGDRVLAKLDRADERPAHHSARVMKLLDKRRDAVLGVIRISERGIRLEPAQKRQEAMEIAADGIGDAKDGDLVEVQVVRAGKHGLKIGRVSRVLGSIKSEKAVSMIAIHANDIPHVFPDAALKDAEKAKPFSVQSNSKHEDWRALPLVTIDPADAKDHDDAIYAEEDAEAPGGHVVTVAIADVAWYVRPGTALDLEALKRGNSVYFPDRVVPMLPERISNDLCSLREGEDRPALAVRMWFSADGRKIRHSFHRVVMRSHAKLSYPQAQAAIDGKEKGGGKAEELLETVLRPLWSAYACLRRGREARGPLELDLPERKVLLKPDGTVDRVVVPERLDAHRLVEEFMIQANVAAAETLERNKQALVYRIHDAPTLAKLESLREFLKSLNISLARAGNMRAEQFNRILEQVEGTDRQELVSQVVLRSQSQAEYAPANIGHFGLNLLRYAHFTSPIRRYADLIVHRALIAALKLGEGGITGEQEAMLEVIATDISLAERRAMQAERETIDRLIAGFLSEKIGETFSGRINGVTRAGLFVTLDATGADGFIPISLIGDDYFRYDEVQHSVTGDETGATYQMGQKVDVRLVEAAPVAGALRFEMLSKGATGARLSRSRPIRRVEGHGHTTMRGRRTRH
jgi:ribonuclease R